MALMSLRMASRTKTPSTSAANRTELNISMSCVGRRVLSASLLARTKLSACSRVS